MANENNILEHEGTEQKETEQKETKTFTEEDVLKLIESESNKRVTEALKKQEKKYQKQLSLAQLDGDERAKAEKDNRIAELEELVAQMNVEKNRSDLKSTLSARGLSAEFADLINITDDLEESQKKIDTLDKLFKAAVKEEVNKRLAANGGAPRSSSASGEITKETFKAMSLSQQAAIARDNRELYNRLTQN